MDTMHQQYLGDGVYASFDGFQIWLAVNHHSNKVVALEPDVFRNLIQYQHELKNKLMASALSQGTISEGKTHDQEFDNGGGGNDTARSEG